MIDFQKKINWVEKAYNLKMERVDFKELNDLDLLSRYSRLLDIKNILLSEINDRKLDISKIDKKYALEEENFTPRKKKDESKSSSKNEISIKSNLNNEPNNAKKTNDNSNSNNTNKLEDLTKNDLKKVLEEHNISFKSTLKKDELIDLVRKNCLIRVALKIKK